MAIAVEDCAADDASVYIDFIDINSRVVASSFVCKSTIPAEYSACTVYNRNEKGARLVQFVGSISGPAATPVGWRARDAQLRELQKMLLPSVHSVLVASARFLEMIAPVDAAAPKFDHRCCTAQSQHEERLLTQQVA